MKSITRCLALSCAFLSACISPTTSANASDTSKILAVRAKAGEPIVLGQWHAGFTEVKNYAVTNGLPLLAIWSNGEECSHCKKLERCLAQSVFKTWMKDSGIVFYFACNEDKSSDDKYGGKGYTWCWKNQSLNLFPFVRFYWKAKAGTVLADGTMLDADKVLIDKAIIGDKFDNYKDKAEGAKYAVSYAKKIYKQYIPAKEDDASVVLEPEKPVESETADVQPPAEGAGDAEGTETNAETDASTTPASPLPCRCCTCDANCSCRK